MATENTTVKLSLRKSYLENYLRFIFDTKQGPIPIVRTEALGKYIFSRIRYSETPIHTAHEGHQVEITLPKSGSFTTQNHFPYFTAEDMLFINDFIVSSSYLDFRLAVNTGCNDLNMDRKKVISMYSDLIYGEDKYEMLKKDDYRRRQKVTKWLHESTKALGY